MRASAHHLRRSKHRAPGRRGGVGGVPCRSALQAGLRSFLALLICGVSKTRSSGRLIRWHSSVRGPGCKKRRLRAVRYGIVFWRSPRQLLQAPSIATSQGCVFMIINNLLLSRTVIPFLLRTTSRISISSRPLQSSKMSSLSEVSGKAAGAFEQTKAAFEFISFVNDSPTRE
jgi:hypothetical protein